MREGGREGEMERERGRNEGRERWREGEMEGGGEREERREGEGGRERRRVGRREEEVRDGKGEEGWREKIDGWGREEIMHSLLVSHLVDTNGTLYISTSVP